MSSHSEPVWQWCSDTTQCKFESIVSEMIRDIAYLGCRQAEEIVVMRGLLAGLQSVMQLVSYTKVNLS